MDRREQFYACIQEEMAVTLATAADGNVSMRAVSPVCCEGSILIFTAPGSKKYRQLRANPHCCIAAGMFFAEAEAEFCGATMLPENERLRAVYSEKFPGAFSEGVAFGGRDAEFLLLRPTRLSGWAFENDAPSADGVPTVPFEQLLDTGTNT